MSAASEGEEGGEGLTGRSAIPFTEEQLLAADKFFPEINDPRHGEACHRGLYVVGKGVGGRGKGETTDAVFA